jgi:F-type H+-transporting ATPase subunit b
MGAPEGLFKGAIELSLWTIVVFVLLLLVLRQFAWGPILEGLRTREEGIARDKAEAEHARRLAAEVRQRAEEELARVLAQNTELVNKAKQDAAAQAAEELARGRTDLQGERDRLRRELAIERDQALADMLAKTANLATLISRKVIGRDLSHDDHHRLLDEALAEFRAAGMKRVEDLESARA